MTTGTKKWMPTNIGRGLVALLIVVAVVAGIIHLGKSTMDPAQVKLDADVIGPLAEQFRLDHEKRCPTIDDLQVQGKPVGPDPWGSKYEIICDQQKAFELGTITIVSFGPDKQRGTSDDIRMIRSALKTP